jgi:hypothetical protein
VVIELFTSEGCSSCPPADAVLARLGRRSEVLPLAFHVDYWDALGWADPFASSVFTARQQAYSAALGRRGMYTPQAIVDGQDEFLGGDASRAERALAVAAKRTKTRVLASLQEGALVVEVGPLRGGTAGAAADLVLALTLDHATVSVKGGENAGRQLEHTAIVRELRLLGPALPSGTRVSAAIGTPSATSRPTHATVFVQEQSSRKILGAATVALSSK